MGKFFKISSSLDLIEVEELLLSRYSNFNYVLMLDFEEGYELIQKAYEKDLEKMLWDRWLVDYRSMTKDNFVNFIYSKNGFKFMSKVLTAVNADSAVSVNKYLPKVDWTKSWTVEEILKDYGYTELEIEDIMEDLNNFRGMDN